MRIVATIPHPQLKISIFLYNEKYIIEIEAAQYKQTFKISQDSVNGPDDVKKLCSDELISGCMQRFSGMHADFKKAFEQFNSNNHVS
jgi:hypothetical protein